jgi:uncharacterized membrane protein
MVPTRMEVSRAKKFRRAFTTGLFVLAPVWLTAYIILLIVRLLGGVLSPYVRYIAVEVMKLDEGSKLVGALSDIVAFVVTVILITLFGFIVQRVLGQRLYSLIDRMLNRIPVVGDIYNAVRKLLEAFFGDKKSFRGVVATRFPNETSWAIGFVTAESTMIKSNERMLHVFVPTTPNPTSGFLFFVAEKETIMLDITTDEAFKLIISGGTIYPDKFK